MSLFADKPLSDPCWAERPEGYYWVRHPVDGVMIAQFCDREWSFFNGVYLAVDHKYVSRLVILSDRLEPPSESHPILSPTEEPSR